MANDPVEVVLTIMSSLLMLSILLIIVSAVSAMLSSTQCQQYIQQIDRLKSDIGSGQAQFQQCSNTLNNCNSEYERLIAENITKKDIEDLKYSYDLIYQQNIQLNQKFETINNRFITAYNQLNTNYSISVVINFALVLGFGLYVSFAIIDVALFEGSLFKSLLHVVWRHMPEDAKQHARNIREKVRGGRGN